MDQWGIVDLIRASVLRHMDDADVARYADPWSDRQRRREAWFEGIHAGTLVPPSRKPNDVIDLIDRAAKAQQQSEFPKLLLTAKPGLIVTPAIVSESRCVLPNLTVLDIGSGKHLLPEDQPTTIASAVVSFVRQYWNNK